MEWTFITVGSVKKKIKKLSIQVLTLRIDHLSEKRIQQNDLAYFPGENDGTDLGLW